MRRLDNLIGPGLYQVPPLIGTLGMLAAPTPSCTRTDALIHINYHPEDAACLVLLGADRVREQVAAASCRSRILGAGQSGNPCSHLPR